MANKEYIERLKQVIFHLHGSDSRHVGSEPVKELFRGEVVWDGEVKVFDLMNHPKAKRCYAWSHPAGPDDTDERFVAVLELPPVDSAINAVRASIVAESKKPKK